MTGCIRKQTRLALIWIAAGALLHRRHPSLFCLFFFFFFSSLSFLLMSRVESSPVESTILSLSPLGLM